MAIEFTCPGCGATLRVNDGPANRLVRCGGCLTLLRVPDVPAPEPPPPPVPAPPPPARPAPQPYFDGEPPPPEHPQYHGRQLRMLVVLGLMAFGVIVCGVLALVGSGPEWRTVESPAGGFKVDLPGDPRDDLRAPAGLKPDPNLKGIGTRVWGPKAEYVVLYGDIPPGERFRKTDPALLDEAAKAIEAGPGVARVVRVVPLTVSGCPAREVEFAAKDGGTYAALLVLADARLYTLVAGGRNTHPGDENVRRFLDSFVVTDDRLLAAAERRVKQARQAADRVERGKLKAVGAAAAAAGFRPAAAELARREALEEERGNVREAGAAAAAAIRTEAERVVGPVPVAPAPRPVGP